MRKKLIGALSGILASVILAVSGFLFIESHHQRSKAYECLREIASLRLGTATFSDAQQLARRYGGQPWSGTARQPECSVQDCNLRFVFENTMLNHLQKQKRISLMAGVWVKDGYIVSKEVDYSIMTTTEYSQFLYFMFDRRAGAGVQGYEVKRFQVDEHNVPHVLEVTLGPDAPAAVRSRAYALDLSCLSRYYGCNDGLSIFPSGL